MSIVEQLRKQVQALTARLDHFERHGVAKPPITNEPKPNGALTNRLDHAYQRNKPRLQRALVSVLVEQYGNLAHGDNCALRGSVKQPFDLEALPHRIAGDLTRENLAREELEGSKRVGVGVDNTARIARLEVELAAMVGHSADLLASTQLPPIPPELEAKARKLGLLK